MQSENKEMTWDQFLDEHWRQFKLACERMNFGGRMVALSWREYVLYDLCKRHNTECEEAGRPKFFIFEGIDG